jgi:branched-chain amino acid transport system substrate-binding protein
VKFEIIPVDNKLSPTESLNALKAAIDQGARYVIQGNGSSVATGADRCGQQAQRAQSRARRSCILNDSAVDPDLTNSKCSYWHFRFDADTTMKMEAMTTFIKEQQGRQEDLSC